MECGFTDLICYYWLFSTIFLTICFYLFFLLYNHFFTVYLKCDRLYRLAATTNIPFTLVKSIVLNLPLCLMCEHKQQTLTPTVPRQLLLMLLHLLCYHEHWLPLHDLDAVSYQQPPCAPPILRDLTWTYPQRSEIWLCLKYLKLDGDWPRRLETSLGLSDLELDFYLA